ncbi:MAG: hypothetical protein ACTSRH_00340 [Promethearchaeota archaeon]
MTSYRLIIGIIVGIIFSFLSAFFFHIEEITMQIPLYVNSDFLKVLILLIGANFKFDIISSFLSSPSILVFLSPQILSTIFIGYIAGTIVKGVKRGLIASSMIIVIDILIWMLLSVISGEDLMSFFQDVQLISTIGGILSALLGATLGGLLGGLITGPYEDI